MAKWALCLLVASLPFEMPNRTFRWEIPTMTAAIFLVTTLFEPRAAYFRRIPAALVCFGLFLYAAAVSIVLHGWVDKLELAQHALLLVQAMLVFWAASNLMRREDVARAVLLSFALGCIIVAALPLAGVGRTAEVVWTGGERVTAFGQNANFRAKMLAAGVLVVLGLAYGRVRPLIRPTWLAAPTVAVLGIAIVETGSRGGLMALAAGLVAFAAGRTRTVWAGLRNGVLAVLVIGFLGVMSARTEVTRNRIVDTAETGTTAGRSILFTNLWQMFQERPWTGWGTLNNQYELANRIADLGHLKRDSHNLVLELLTTTGVMGALPFLLGLALCITWAWRARAGPHGVLPFALLAAQLVGAMTGNPIASKLFWLVLAFGVAAGPEAAPARAPVTAALVPAGGTS